MTRILSILFLCISLSLFGQNAQINLTVYPKDVIKEISPYIYGKNGGIPQGNTDADWRRVESAGITMYREHGGNNCTKYNWKKKITSHPNWYYNVYGTDWDAAAQKKQNRRPDVQGMWGFQLSGWVAASNQYNFGDWDFNRANWWPGVEWNVAGNGRIVFEGEEEPEGMIKGQHTVNTTAGTRTVIGYLPGNYELYLEPCDAEYTVGILKHWFETLKLDKKQFLYWNMDNEPCVWTGTHKDVINKPMPVEEFIQKYVAVASLARTYFPEIKIVGPSFTNEWQWYNWHQGTLPEDPNNPGSKRISWSEYFIKRIAEEQKRTGLRLLDVLCYHSYLCDADRRDISLNLYRIFYDTEYVHKGANGVKTVIGGWDNNINKQFIFKRATDWLNKYMGADHGVNLGITELGCLYSDDANVIAVSYASLLGTFAENNVELLTPWNWDTGQWETVHLFRRYTGTKAVKSSSTENLVVSAYSSINEKGDTLMVAMVNRSDNARNIALKVEGMNLENTKITSHQLSGLPEKTETFFSRTQNALKHSESNLENGAFAMNLPKLSVTVIRIPLKTKTVEPPLNVNDQMAPDVIKLYPNPVNNGLFTLETKDLRGEMTITITDAAGRTVHSLNMNAENSTQINVAQLEKGMYIVNIHHNNKTFNQKIIIE